MSETNEKKQCPYCPRELGSQEALWHHVRDKHPGTPNIRGLKPKRPRQVDNDPSMGDLVAEAHWNADPELDWVRDMFSIRLPREAS